MGSNLSHLRFEYTHTQGGVGVGVLPCISHIGVCTPKGGGGVWSILFLTGIDFAYFGLESGIVFEGTMGVYEYIYDFSSN